MEVIENCRILRLERNHLIKCLVSESLVNFFKLTSGRTCPGNQVSITLFIFLSSTMIPLYFVYSENLFDLQVFFGQFFCEFPSESHHLFKHDFLKCLILK